VTGLLHIPFNRPTLAGDELLYVSKAIDSGQLAAGGRFTAACERWLEEHVGVGHAMVVHSATAALEVSALLLEVGPGDEVIMPSYTFVSTANAFALRGATPVFVDIRPDTLNIDERLIGDAFTERTKAIVVVHYAGVPAAMDELDTIAAEAGVAVVEDAAQALLSRYRGRPAGSIGSFAAVSFHETKNVISGEGGALLLRDASDADRAHVFRDKGTDRSHFVRGEVDKYSWVDLGSAYGPSELTAAFLLAQMERAEYLTAQRKRLWAIYYDGVASLEDAGLLRRPIVPEDVEHNGHLFYILVDGIERRDRVLRGLGERGVGAIFHYVPLHTSPAGRRFGRACGSLPVTDRTYEGLIRLPLWPGIGEENVASVIASLEQVLDD
jgi:dTDP-4-amino-4,6-dideoxygalactose transaminase